jgi:Na+/H+ antiporter NhaD/arsenite permease-like protein
VFRVKVAVTVLLASRLANVQVAAVDVPPVAAQPDQLTVEPVPAVAVRVIELP